MKTILQKNASVFALSLLIMCVFTLVSCQKELTKSKAAQSSAQQNASAHVDYVYLVGEEPTIEGPDKTVAPNGDTIIIEGSGTLSIHSKSVTGSGEFEHKNAAGTVLVSGTWEAQELISFKSFGTPGDPFPPEFEGGKAVIRIHLSPSAGGDGFDALLQIYCVIAGVAPPGFGEGIRLVVPDVINFNTPVFGQTLFIRQ